MLDNLQRLYQLARLFLLKQGLEESDTFYAYLAGRQVMEEGLTCLLLDTEANQRLEVIYDKEYVFCIYVYNGRPMLIKPIGTPASMRHHAIDPGYGASLLSQVINSKSSLGVAAMHLDLNATEVVSLAVPLRWSDLTVNRVQQILDQIYLETRAILEPALLDLRDEQQGYLDSQQQYEEDLGDEE